MTHAPLTTATCPAPDALAGYVEHRLGTYGRTGLERHMSACRPCRDALAELVLSLHAESASGRSPVPVKRFSYSAAAVVLSFFGLAAAGVWQDHDRASAPGTTWGRLEAAAGELRGEHDGLFVDFQPYSRSELADVPGADVMRGTTRRLTPVGNIHATQPEVNWFTVTGATSYVFTLRQADGSRIWRTETKSPTLTWPEGATPLTPGLRYILSASADGLLGRETTSSAFSVASLEVKDRFERRRTAILSGEEDVAHLLEAHCALRMGFLEEAATALEKYRRRNPGDPLGSLTLAHILNFTP